MIARGGEILGVVVLVGMTMACADDTTGGGGTGTSGTAGSSTLSSMPTTMSTTNGGGGTGTETTGQLDSGTTGDVTTGNGSGASTETGTTIDTDSSTGGTMTESTGTTGTTGTTESTESTESTGTTGIVIGSSSGTGSVGPGECNELLGVPCGMFQYCDYPDDLCGVGLNGTCQPTPGICPAIFDPHCGCDGVTHGNPCEANAPEPTWTTPGAC